MYQKLSTPGPNLRIMTENLPKQKAVVYVTTVYCTVHMHMKYRWPAVSYMDYEFFRRSDQLNDYK